MKIKIGNGSTLELTGPIPSVCSHRAFFPATTHGRGDGVCGPFSEKLDTPFVELTDYVENHVYKFRVFSIEDSERNGCVSLNVHEFEIGYNNTDNRFLKYLSPHNSNRTAVAVKKSIFRGLTNHDICNHDVLFGEIQKHMGDVNYYVNQNGQFDPHWYFRDELVEKFSFFIAEKVGF